MNLAISTSIPEKNWKLKTLLFSHIIVALLMGSLLWPLTRVYWEMLDIAFFKAINGSLSGHHNWQVFWAMANHKLADWVEDLCILGFWFVYIRSKQKSLRLRGVAELLFCILYVAAILFFINKMVFREHLQIPRNSPTLVVESSVRLSDEVTWMKVKDVSVSSFPGDHGTTALLFAATLSYFASWRMGLLASAYAAFLCLPRLITGAHWLSDIIVGSGSIAILLLSWVFCTPLHKWIITALESLLQAFWSKTKRTTASAQDM
jgi:membrane-associated phospholipid phosphatase